MRAGETDLEEPAEPARGLTQPAGDRVVTSASGPNVNYRDFLTETPTPIAESTTLDSMDSFDHFEQQEYSYHLLQEHAQALVEDAQEMTRADFDAQPVGLILEPSTSEAQEILGAIAKATGQDLAGKGFLGVVPREFALVILRANCPMALDHIEPKATERSRKLPIVAATKDGFRLAAVDYDVPF